MLNARIFDGIFAAHRIADALPLGFVFFVFSMLLINWHWLLSYPK
jgi:hypothetical protein